jgi:tetratricopeptide (TPR) repeat protein
MKTFKVTGMVIVAALLAAVAAPAALAAEANVVDIKQVENQFILAQNMVVQGGIDAGLQAVQDARAKAVTTELVARAAFIAKLAEVRVADRLGDQAKALAALNDAMGQAKLPDQVAAVWQLGLAMAQATAGGKNPVAATPVVEFMATGPAPVMKQFAVNVELAKLRMATGNLGAAETELGNAARRVTGPQDWSSWVAVVTQLAVATDGGQNPQAGADVFVRIREACKPAASALDLAKARFLMGRGVLADVGVLVDRAVQGAASEEQFMSALSLGYDLAVAFKQAGKKDEAAGVLGKAEALAQSQPVTAALANLRGGALKSAGEPGKAADVFWSAAQAVKTPQDRDQLLVAFGGAMVAAGRGGEVVAKFQAAKAPASVYTALAGAMAGAGDSAGAMGVLALLTPQAFAEDPGSVVGIEGVMRQVQGRRQQIAAEQGARCRAIAAGFDGAAKASKDVQAAAELAKKAAALNALAAQVEK